MYALLHIILLTYAIHIKVVEYNVDVLGKLVGDMLHLVVDFIIIKCAIVYL